MENTNIQPKTHSKRKLSTLLLVGVIIAAISIGAVIATAVYYSSINANLGTVTITTPPTPTSSDTVTSASLNGVSPISGYTTNDIQFANSSMSVGTPVTLSITVTNNGDAPSTINYASITTNDGYGNAYLTFTGLTVTSDTPANVGGSAVIINPNGGWATFTWTVTPIADGIVTPTVVIPCS